MKVYLAGPLGGHRTKKIREERAYIKWLLDKAGIAYYDPFADEECKKKRIPTSYSRRTMLFFLNKDLWALRECDIFLNINGNIPSIGTTWEMAHHFYKVRSGKRFIISSKMFRKKLCTFATVQATKIFKDAKSAVEYLRRIDYERTNGKSG